MLEKDFQKKVVQWLKKQGCFVMKTDPSMHTGISDLFFCKEGFYGFIECKKSKTAKFRPGQKEFVDKMNDWSYATVAYPENWEQIKKDLEEML